MPSSFATRAIGRDVSITILTASSLNSDEKLFFGRGNYFTFPEVHPNGWTVRKLRGTPVPGRGGLRFAFYGRVSTEDWQDPVTSRVRQREQAAVLVAGHGT